jgi:polyribonucleotide nucleotidyltransferase
MMIGASMDSIAMVEGEMKEISEAEMLKQLNLLTTHQNSAQLRLQAAFGKKRSSYLRREKENEAIYAKVKAASYDKIMLLQARFLKQERTAAFAESKEVKLYLLKKNCRKMEFSF